MNLNKNTNDDDDEPNRITKTKNTKNKPISAKTNFSTKIPKIEPIQKLNAKKRL